MQVLFVCTGNTCRSSMAEYLFRDMVKESGREDEITIASAGVSATTDNPAADQAIEVLSRRGIGEIEDHTATPVSDEVVKDVDLILTMTQSHKRMLLNQYPELEERVYTLKEYTKQEQEDGDLDIKDPYGQPVEVYQACADEIMIRLRRLLKQL